MFRYRSGLPILIMAALAIPACQGSREPIRLPSPTTEPIAQAEPNLTEQEMMEFLLHAEIIGSKTTPKGVTLPLRLTLTDGKISHDAGFQAIDESRTRQTFPDGHVEINFRDTYKFNIAAYELAKMVGLGGMMPVTVQRSYLGKPGSLTWWLPVMMDEVTRNAKKIEPPEVDAWNKQMYKKRVFAELAYDNDPNLTNLLISQDWHIWMIDFTRAFRQYKELRNEKNITGSKCERHLLEKLRTLDREELTRRTEGFLGKLEIDGIMARRDRIVEIFDDLIAKRGEQAVLYDDPVPK